MSSDLGGKGLTKMRVDELVTDKKILWQCVDSDPQWIGTTISFDMEEKREDFNHFSSDELGGSDRILSRM